MSSEVSAAALKSRPDEKSLITMLVVCEGDSKTRFDREYYANVHFALAKECWAPFGLVSAEAFFPAAAEVDRWLSIGVYRFKTRDGINAALTGPPMERMMADVPKFTDTTEISRSIFEPF